MSSSSIEENNNNKPEIIIGNYIIQDKIGQGSFATVYKAQHKVMFNFLCKEYIIYKPN
jgi:serine/threonine protein kinase